MITQTYVYDDPEHPNRPTSAVFSPAYTAEDQALLAGLEQYEKSLCRCGQPRHVAWHPDMDGYFDASEFTCYACTAAQPDPKPGQTRQPVTYSLIHNTRPLDRGPLPPFLDA